MDWALIGLPKVVDFQIGGSFALLLNGKHVITLDRLTFSTLYLMIVCRGHLSECTSRVAQSMTPYPTTIIFVSTVLWKGLVPLNADPSILHNTTNVAVPIADSILSISRAGSGLRRRLWRCRSSRTEFGVAQASESDGSREYRVDQGKQRLCVRDQWYVARGSLQGRSALTCMTLCAVRQEVFAWGLNSMHGRLGTATTTNIYGVAKLDTRGLLENDRQKITKIALGSQTSFLLVQD